MRVGKCQKRKGDEIPVRKRHGERGGGEREGGGSATHVIKIGITVKESKLCIAMLSSCVWIIKLPMRQAKKT